jgi:hypothetical protein
MRDISSIVMLFYSTKSDDLALNNKVHGMKEHFVEVLVPTEKVVEMRVGYPRISERNRYLSSVVLHC